MGKLRVNNLGMSLDGFVAGAAQSVENPLGIDGERLHEWMFDDPSGIDAERFDAGNRGIGAWIMGRNMFGPIRGDWPDDSWRGWWGAEPPYHCPVFVLTHHARDPQPMDGGTVFHFVTDGIESALEQAVAAAGGADVRLGGGASTIQQYLRAGLVDELHVCIAPVLLQRGERLFEGLDDLSGYEVAELVSGPAATHAHIVRSPQT